MSDIVLNQEQYIALVSLARNGSTSPDQKRALEAFLRDIDRTNNITRYLLVVQWQEPDQPLPPTTRFPEKWPPELRLTLERTDRTIAKSDVLAAVAAMSSNPVNILVTRDPGGLVGWTKLEDFFTT